MEDLSTMPLAKNIGGTGVEAGIKKPGLACCGLEAAILNQAPEKRFMARQRLRHNEQCRVQD